MFFTFDQLINIVLRLILLLQPELLLVYKKTAKDIALLTFYINNIFEVFKTYQEKFIFLCNYFFSFIIWFKLKLAIFKLKIKITKIFAFKEKHKIGQKIKLKPDKIQKTFIWLILEN